MSTTGTGDPQASAPQTPIQESGSDSSESGSDSVAEPGSDSASDLDSDSGPADLGDTELKRVVESLIFVADKPIPLARLRELSGVVDGDRLRAILDDLVADYQDRGIILDDVAGGYQFHTSPLTATYVQKLVEGRPVRLSRAQLETLAIIAYRQPITRPEIDEIRGVDSGNTLKILLDRGLIRVLGKREEPGRPLLYGTTSEFLEFFNLSQIGDLPTLREYHELTEDSMRQVERLSAALGERDPGRPAEPAPVSPADHDPDEPGAESGPEYEPESEPELEPEPDPEPEPALEPEPDRDADADAAPDKT